MFEEADEDDGEFGSDGEYGEWNLGVISLG